MHPVGMLLRGFLSHENALSRVLSVLVPVFAYVQRASVRRTGVLLTITLTILSGSRGAIPSMVVALVAYAFLRRLRVDGRASGTATVSGDTRLGAAAPSPRYEEPWRAVGNIFSWVPFVLFLASTALLILLPPGALTGRGDVYQLVRSGLGENPLIGSGLGYFRHFALTGQIEFLPQHEHGQAALVLNRSGLLGWALMCGALLQCGLRSTSSSQWQMAAMVAPVTPIFLTEAVMSIDSGGVVWPLFFLGVLIAQPRSPTGLSGKGSPPAGRLTVEHPRGRR